MAHILALHAAHAAKPAFNILGWKAPELLGQILHWIARLFKLLTIIFSFIFLFLRGFTSTGAWRLLQMLFLVVIGLVGIPSISPKVQHWTAMVTQGSAVGSTGASIGIVITLSVIFGLTIFSTLIRNPAMSGEE